MRVGVTTFGGDEGQSGISQYIINLLREWSIADADTEFDVLGYPNVHETFLPDSQRMSPLIFGNYLRPPVFNIAWHQFGNAV